MVKTLVSSKTQTLTKASLVETLSEELGVSKRQLAEWVDQIFEIMKVTLVQGDSIKISGFGNFVVRSKNPRMGRNPKTGEEIGIDARRVITFKPSDVLRDSLSQDNGDD